MNPVSFGAHLKFEYYVHKNTTPAAVQAERDALDADLRARYPGYIHNTTKTTSPYNPNSFYYLNVNTKENRADQAATSNVTNRDLDLLDHVSKIGRCSPTLRLPVGPSTHPAWVDISGTALDDFRRDYGYHRAPSKRSKPPEFHFTVLKA